MGRIHRKLRKGNYAERLGSGSAVFLGGVLEYLVAEVLELSGNTSQANKKRRIIPRHIVLAVRGDEELAKLFENVTISEGGICPNIQPELLPRKTSKSKNNSANEQDGASQSY